MARYAALSHHGILGQKWGIRRYQNADGTLTAEGRKRYGYSVPIPKQDLTKLSENKKYKLAKKQYIKDWRNIGKRTDNIMEDFTYLREADDLKKWGDNKEFKSDMKKAYNKYVKYVNDGGYGPDYQDELLAPLYKKYPKAKDILDGMSFWEASEKPFDSKEYTIDSGGELIYSNWIRDLWNNDYYYTSNYEDLTRATVAERAASTAMTDEYIKIYGKNIVDKLIKQFG